MSTPLQGLVAQMEQVFARIGATRMQGVPVLNAALCVQAVGFEVVAEDDVQVLQGILITPWFMNLLRLPLVPDAAANATESGSKQSHRCGGQLFEFIAAYEDALGSFEACSLFSPMFEFADQAGALATATEILKLLRTQPKANAKQATQPSAPKPAATLSMPSRRGLLLGRARPGAAP
jgi:[NiFe] hydrogenase assembly HybE family chaperone